MPLKRLSFNDRDPFWIVAIGASILLSLWQINFTPVLNTDGILYLIATEKLLSSGLTDSLAIYSWPLFQIAIASLHKITGLSLLASGQLLMIVSFTLVVVGFCRVVKTIGGCRSTLWFALLIILCNPSINDFRASLIRDPGMIAFVLLALTEQIRLADNGRWRHASLWLMYMGLAFLFRVETLAVAALAPIAMLVLVPGPLKYRLTLFAKMLALPVLILAVAIFLSMFTSFNQHMDIKVFSDIRFIEENIEQISGKIASLSNIISNQVLGEFSRHDATLVLFVSIATITLVSLLRAITVLYLFPLAISWISQTLPTLKPRILFVWWYALIVFSYLFCFALFVQFSTTRYNLLLSILLIIPLPFYLQKWWNADSRQRLVRGLIVFLLLVNGLDGIISGDRKKTYVVEAAEWVNESPLIAKNTLISNRPYLSYLSRKSTTENILHTVNAGNQQHNETIDMFWFDRYAYAYRVKQGANEVKLKSDLERAEGQIFQIFEGADNHSVYVFSVTKDLPRSLELQGRR